MLSSLLAVVKLPAQENWTRGYVVMGTDTLHGFVYEQSAARNQELCRFKSINGVSKDYQAVDITAWAIGGSRHYRTVTIEEKGIAQRRFAQVLLNGYADLLVYVDKDGVNRYVFCDANDSCQEVNDPRAPSNLNKAKGRLIYLLGSDDELRKILYQKDFTQDQIVHAVEIYNLKKNGQQSKRYAEEKKKAIIKFGVHAGYGFSTLQFAQTKYHNLGGKYDLSSAPVFGLSTDLHFGGHSSRAGLRMGLNYQTHQYTSEETMFKMSDLRIPLYFVFKPSRKNKSFEVMAGMFADKQISIEQEGTFLSDPNLSVTMTAEKLVEFPEKKTGIGLSAGIGYLFPVGKKQKLSVSALYSASWSNMVFRYYGNVKGLGDDWYFTSVIYNHSYIDLRLGLIF
jgi:hypothetical protein